MEFVNEVVLRGLELGDKNDNRIVLGSVLVYATDMTELNTSAVLGLNVIRAFESRIVFGEDTFIELTPRFDTSSPVMYEDFNRSGSRFGLW